MANIVPTRENTDLDKAVVCHSPITDNWLYATATELSLGHPTWQKAVEAAKRAGYSKVVVPKTRAAADRLIMTLRIPHAPGRPDRCLRHNLSRQDCVAGKHQNRDKTATGGQKGTQL